MSRDLLLLEGVCADCRGRWRWTTPGHDLERCPTCGSALSIIARCQQAEPLEPVQVNYDGLPVHAHYFGSKGHYSQANKRRAARRQEG